MNACCRLRALIADDPQDHATRLRRRRRAAPLAVRFAACAAVAIATGCAAAPSEPPRGDAAAEATAAPEASGPSRGQEPTHAAPGPSGARAGERAAPGFTPGAPAPDDFRIDVHVEDVELADVMEDIGRQVGRNVLVAPEVRETVRVSFQGIPWREAVDVIAAMTRCTVEERAGGILLLTQPMHVTIQSRSANVRTVFHLLAAYAGKQVILSAEVQGTVDVEVREQDWLEAMHDLARPNGYVVLESGGDLLRVVRAPDGR